MIDDPHRLFYRRAVVLFNLGGPLKLSEVKGFLFNLFYDRAIIDIPNPFRYCLARIISTLREIGSKKEYAIMGGGSPILENTLQQADALQSQLVNIVTHDAINIDHRVFVAMRYSSPFPCDVIDDISNYDPNDIILLPLYPQYSYTTTESFVQFWQSSITQLSAPVLTVREYNVNRSFIDAHCDILRTALTHAHEKYRDVAQCRILFSAHGLPQRIVDAGDPYQMHVNATVAAIMKELIEEIKCHKISGHVVCYQSKVGPMKWLQPSIETEIRSAARDNVGVVVVPIAFVSEHLETLVELDVRYMELANELNVPFYIRTKTLGVHKMFIECLKQIILSQPISRNNSD